MRADELCAMSTVTREFQPLALNQALLQAYAHQAAVVRNPIERAEFVGAHVVTRGKMAPEMFEALSAAGTKQAFAIEPCIDFGDGMKLARINFVSPSC